MLSYFNHYYFRHFQLAVQLQRYRLLRCYPIHHHGRQPHCSQLHLPVMKNPTPATLSLTPFLSSEEKYSPSQDRWELYLYYHTFIRWCGPIFSSALNPNRFFQLLFLITGNWIQVIKSAITLRCHLEYLWKHHLAADGVSVKPYKQMSNLRMA